MYGGWSDVEVFLNVRFGGRPPQYPRVGVNECQVLSLRGSHWGFHRSYHVRKDPLYDIAAQLRAISSASQGVHEILLWHVQRDLAPKPPA
jgi:hypothetical protein